MAVAAVTLAGWNTFLQVLKLGLSTTAAGAFISPLSLYIALTLALNGAGPGSETHKQLWAVLQQTPFPAGGNLQSILKSETAFNADTSKLQQSLTRPQGNGTEVLIANAVWTNKTPVKKPYADSMLSLYQAPVKPATSVAEINAWASQATKGLITQVMAPGTPFDMVLTNAVYFKGSWVHPFKKESTMPQSFTTDKGAKVDVPTMQARFKSSDPGGRPVQYAETAGFKGVRMPYAGGSFSAIALLPTGKDFSDPKKIDAALAALDIGTVVDQKTWDTPSAVMVYLPKFKLKNDLTLSKALQAQGMTDAFKSSANFSRLSDVKLLVSDVLQSVFIQVDEKGTEAAAVTALVMRVTSMPPPAPEILFDRPFLFMVVDDSSGTVLFLGAVKDPSKAPV